MLTQMRNDRINVSYQAQEELQVPCGSWGLQQSKGMDFDRFRSHTSFGAHVTKEFDFGFGCYTLRKVKHQSFLANANKQSCQPLSVLVV